MAFIMAKPNAVQTVLLVEKSLNGALHAIAWFGFIKPFKYPWVCNTIVYLNLDFSYSKLWIKAQKTALRRSRRGKTEYQKSETSLLFLVDISFIPIGF